MLYLTIRDYPTLMLFQTVKFQFLSFVCFAILVAPWHTGNLAFDPYGLRGPQNQTEQQSAPISSPAIAFLSSKTAV